MWQPASAVSLTLIALLSSGCAGQTVPVPVSDVRPFKPIPWTCETASGEARRGIVAHNSVYDSLKTGRKVVYADDCPKPKPVS